MNELTIQQESTLVEYNFERVLSPQGAIDVAKTIKEYAEKNSLTTKIQGRVYPYVEAWQFAGLQLGLFPFVVSVIDLSTEKECKWRAEVEIRRATGETVGFGVAVCSNKESKKRNFDDYAICSMAQTRATGKAFRTLVGWMFKLADMEATPAEEMDELDPQKVDNGPTASVVIKEYKKFAEEAIKGCSSAGQVRDLAKIATLFMKHQPDADLIDLCRKQFEALSNLGDG